MQEGIVSIWLRLPPPSLVRHACPHPVYGASASSSLHFSFFHRMQVSQWLYLKCKWSKSKNRVWHDPTTKTSLKFNGSEAPFTGKETSSIGPRACQRQTGDTLFTRCRRVPYSHCIHIYIYMHSPSLSHTHTHTYVHTYTHTHTHTHTHTLTEGKSWTEFFFRLFRV